MDLYEQQPKQAPGWYSGLHWEDVLVGLLLHEYAEPQTRPDGEAYLSLHHQLVPVQRIVLLMAS